MAKTPLVELERSRLWRAQNKEQVQANNVAYRARNQERLSLYLKTYRAANHFVLHIKSVCRRFHISKMAYLSLVMQHGNRCGICGDKPKGLKRYLCLDHNHTTGETRGLLCSTCNQAIGLLKDDAAMLRRAADYIDAHDPHSRPQIDLAA